MAGEFRIKTGLLLGPQPTQPVISIQDTSSSITTDASSILVTAKAIYDFHTANAPESYLTLDGSTLSPTDPTVDVKLGRISIDEDSGAVSLVDMSVTSTPVAGTEESYAFNIDGTAIAKIYAEGDGAGGIQEAAFKVLEAFYAESSVYFSGIPDLSTSYVLFYNPTTDQVTYASESAISGVTQLSALTDVSIGGTIPDGSVLVYNSALGKWTYGAQITSVDWGDINGSISDQTDLSTWITNLSNDIDDVSSRTDDVETSIGTLNGLIQTNISDISNIETSLGTLNGLIQTNISDISNIETSLGTLNGLIQTNISDISNIETSLGTLNGLIQTNISDISNLETSVYTVLNQWNINQDISIAAISTAQGNYVLKTGDTMSGPLTISSGGLSVANDVSISGSALISTDLTVTGDAYVGGSLTIDGSLYVVNIETIDVSANFIHLNTGLTGTPPSWIQSGIVVERGDSSAYAFVFDESLDTFRIGVVNGPDASGVFDDSETQAVATREDAPISGGISYWNDSLYRFDTSANLRYEGGNLQVNNDVSVGSQIFAPNLTSSGNEKIVFWNSTTGEITQGDPSLLGLDTSTFISLKDTPSSYLDGSAGASIVVNDAQNGLEFAPRIWREESNEVTLANENADVLFYENIEIEPDSGVGTFVDKDVTASSAENTEESYTFDMDGITIAKIYAQSDGVGGIKNQKFVSTAVFQAESSVYFTGIPEVSTGQVLFYNPATSEISYADASITGGGGSYWTLDGSTLVPKDESVDVQLSAIQIDTDAGAVTVIDMDVSSATASTEESYAFNIDGSTIAKVWSEADGTGVLQNTGFVVEAIQYMGDPNTNGSWRFYPDSNGDLVFEKRIAGTWTQKGKFTE